jgi:Cu/Ag efflux protein CusF
MLRSSLISAAATLVVLVFAAPPTNGQELTRPSEWLDKLDREHDHLVSKAGHVHARGQVQAIDIGPGTVTVLSEEMQSPDKSIWMPAMRMVFHITNRRMLKGLQPGDAVEFEAARLRNAVMITKIRKVR